MLSVERAPQALTFSSRNIKAGPGAVDAAFAEASPLFRDRCGLQASGPASRELQGMLWQDGVRARDVVLRACFLQSSHRLPFLLAVSRWPSYPKLTCFRAAAWRAGRSRT